MKKYEEAPFTNLSEENLDEYLSHMNQTYSQQSEKRILNKVQSKIVAKEKVGFFAKSRRFSLVVVIILAILLPTTVFAANKIWQVYFQQDKFSSKLNVNSEKKSTDMQGYYLQLNYLPDNWEPMLYNEGEAPIKFWNQNDQSSISTILYSVAGEETFETRYTKEVVAENIGGHQTWIIEKTAVATDLTKEVYVLFEEEEIVLMMWVSENLTNDDLQRIIENAQLIPASGSLNQVMPLNQEINEDGGYIDQNGDFKTGKIPLEESRVAVNAPTIKKIGEPTTFTTLVGGVDEEAQLTLTVNQVSIHDSLSGVIDYQNDPSYQVGTMRQMIEDGVMDEAGNFLPFEAQVYKRGDGINSLDELIATKTSQLKFLKIQVTLENDSDYDLPDYYFQAGGVSLFEKAGYYYQNQNGEEEFTVPQAYTAHDYYELAYLENGSSNYKSYYNIGTLAKKSSQTFEIGFFVPAEDVEHFFLNDNSYENPDHIKNTKFKLFE